MVKDEGVSFTELAFFGWEVDKKATIFNQLDEKSQFI